MKSWTKNVWTGLFGATPRPAATVRSRRIRLTAEALEDRMVPVAGIAEVIWVNTNIDSAVHAPGLQTLREAIAKANTNSNPTVVDVIAFRPNVFGKTILLEQGEIGITQSVNIAGPGVARLRIDGAGDTRIFNIAGGDGIAMKATISGVTLQNGNFAVPTSGTDGGGAIRFASDGSFAGDILTLRNAAFRNNETGDTGGAVLVGNPFGAQGAAKLTIEDCVFSGNTSEVAGGAVAFLNSSNLVVQRSTFSANIVDGSQHGGALDVEDSSSVLVSRSTFVDNITGGEGGAVGLLNTATARIEYTTLARNRADAAGGGVWWLNSAAGTLTVFSSTINANESRGDDSEESFGMGGGIAFLDLGASQFFLLNSTIYGNTSGGNGGGILLSGGTSTLVNDTITKNESQIGDGGGIYASDGAIVNMQNTIIDSNRNAPREVSVTNDISSADGIATWNVQYSLIESVPSGFTFLTNSHNIFGESANLGPLKNNGGPTQTAAFMDLSPAIQRGNVALAKAQGLLWDQRGPGFFRMFFGIDMGAFQSQLRRRW